AVMLSVAPPGAVRSTCLQVRKAQTATNTKRVIRFIENKTGGQLGPLLILNAIPLQINYGQGLVNGNGALVPQRVVTVTLCGPVPNPGLSASETVIEPSFFTVNNRTKVPSTVTAVAPVNPVPTRLNNAPLQKLASVWILVMLGFAL